MQCSAHHNADSGRLAATAAQLILRPRHPRSSSYMPCHSVGPRSSRYTWVAWPTDPDSTPKRHIASPAVGHILPCAPWDEQKGALRAQVQRSPAVLAVAHSKQVVEEGFLPAAAQGSRGRVGTAWLAVVHTPALANPGEGTGIRQGTACHGRQQAGPKHSFCPASDSRNCCPPEQWLVVRGVEVRRGAALRHRAQPGWRGGQRR